MREAAGTVKPITPGHFNAFVAVASRAFAQDPLMTALFGVSSKMRADHPQRCALMRYLLDSCRTMGGTPLGIFDGDTLRGGALWEPPATPRWAHGMRLAVTALQFVPLGVVWPRQTSALLNRYARLSRTGAPKDPHHRLVLLAVDPEHHGRGLGHALVAAVVGLCENNAASTGVALDTENPANVPMYRHWGFDAAPGIALGEVHITPMFRPRERRWS